MKPRMPNSTEKQAVRNLLVAATLPEALDWMLYAAAEGRIVAAKCAAEFINDYRADFAEEVQS